MPSVVTNALGLDLVPTDVLNIPGGDLIIIAKEQNIYIRRLFGRLLSIHSSEKPCTEAAKYPKCFLWRRKTLLSILAKVLSVSPAKKKNANRFIQLRESP